MISRRFAYDPIKRIQDAVRASNVSASRRQQVEVLFVSQSRAMHDIMLEFFRGALTAEEYQSQVQRTSSDYEAQLRATLGNDQYDRINQMIASDVATLIH